MTKSMKNHRITESERQVICAGGTDKLRGVYANNLVRQLVKIATQKGCIIPARVWGRMCAVYGFDAGHGAAWQDELPLLDGYEVKGGEAVKVYPGADSVEEPQKALENDLAQLRGVLESILSEVRQLKGILTK